MQSKWKKKRKSFMCVEIDSSFQFCFCFSFNDFVLNGYYWAKCREIKHRQQTWKWCKFVSLAHIVSPSSLSSLNFLPFLGWCYRQVHAFLRAIYDVWKQLRANLNQTYRFHFSSLQQFCAQKISVKINSQSSVTRRKIKWERFVCIEKFEFVR